MSAKPETRQARAAVQLLPALALALAAAGACDGDGQAAPKPRETRAQAQAAGGEPPSEEARGPEKPGAPEPAAPPAKAPLVKRGRTLMSTYFELSLVDPPSPAQASELLEGALTEIARLETVLSEWRPGTEISQLNDVAGSERWVELSPESLAVIQAGLNVSIWSGGAYDLSWAALRGLYRFDGSGEVPKAHEIRDRLRRVGYLDIQLSREPPRARLKRDGMAIGTGGIAKGYALDEAARRIEAAGHENYLLFAGGQVQVHGSRGGRPWRVGIQHPRDPGHHVGFVELSAGSVSTSGDYEHAFVRDGTLWHHIIDLETGYPARRSVSVTLIAPEGIYADALSTACFVLGPERCQGMLDELPFQAEAVMIGPELDVHVTAGLEGKVTFTQPLVDGRLPRP